MSFAPTDRYELMELKGIEEHELEREGQFKHYYNSKASSL